jgi:hypothetical protein
MILFKIYEIKGKKHLLTAPTEFQNSQAEAISKRSRDSEAKGDVAAIYEGQAELLAVYLTPENENPISKNMKIQTEVMLDQPMRFFVEVMRELRRALEDRVRIEGGLNHGQDPS